MKLYFHSGRPYLDNIELADLTLKEYTSAEFGMPSGHSVSSSCNPLFFFYYFCYYEYKMYWDKQFIKKALIFCGIIIYALSVAYSRIYTGRHSLDQCIAGLMIGTWITNFYWYVTKPFFYDPS